MLKLIVIKYLTKVIWPQNYIFSTTFIKMQFYCDLKTLIESYKNNDLNLVIFEWNWIQHKNRFYFLSKSASSFMIFWGYRGWNKKYYMAWDGGSTHSTHFTLKYFLLYVSQFSGCLPQEMALAFKQKNAYESIISNTLI